ncbi:glycosyltransferase family 4 protein [Teredinibacter purpureus]|uniref:glycosyltransferase family 4 protein n=1 Tax=Teredinibacter purpureus TaxID=2731756 RepID=UPI0005F7BB06|nr:glycosyltransferase family 4 protein [Teredinibacter purpureus]
MSKTTLKILHLTYDMNIGGTEQVIRNIIEGLDSQRYASSVACIDGQVGPWGKALESKGVKHYCLTRKPGFDLRVIRGLRAIIVAGEYDIVHCHQYTPYTYGWFAMLGLNKPIIFTEHGRFYPDTSSWKRRLINPILQRGTAASTAISAATKQALETYENLDGNKIDVIYNGIMDSNCEPDAALREALGIHNTDTVFGTISRLDPIKNHTMMIAAFAEVCGQQKNVKLMIVGDGPMRAELESLVAALHLQDNVIFTGFKPNPQAYLAIMDVFLLPSLSEGTSMTLLEAMSYAKPSIATAVGGTPEILEHGVTGLLVDNKDQGALILAMRDICTNEKMAQELGNNARKIYEERFTLAAMITQYERLYESKVSD